MQKVRNSVIECKPLAGRLIYLTIKTKPLNLSVLNGWTEMADEDSRQ